MNTQKRLLIVDDEPSIVHMLDEFFRMEGYATVCACNASEALEAVNRSLKGRARGEDAGRSSAGDRSGAGDRGGAWNGGDARDDGAWGRTGGRAAAREASDRIDLALLDVNMPGMDGFELCRRIREHLACPIIFLTARVEDVDQLDGFAAGADDYVLKPFSLEVLGGRVRAHLAREERHEAHDAARSQSVRIFSNITIDYAERTVEIALPRGSSEGDGVPAAVHLDLTRTEFDIIALLSKNPGRVYDRVNIYELVWGWDATGDPSIVREHVRRIRKKFAEAGAGEEVVETVWGVGYRWAAR